MWKCLPVIALFATIASADNITWTGTPTHNWDTNTANWTGDPSGRNNGLYAAGDTVTFDDTGSDGIIFIRAYIVDPGPSQIFFNVVNDTYTFSFDVAAAGKGFYETTDVIKDGAGIVHWVPPSGAWNPNPSPLTIHLRAGQIVLPHYNDWNTAPFGSFATVSFEGGTLNCDSTLWGTPIHRTHLTVISNSTFINYPLNAVLRGTGKGTMTADTTLSGEPGAVLTVDAGEFWFNNRWEVSVVDDAVNSLRMINLATVDLSGFDSHLVISTNGKLTETEYVLIDYSLGIAQNMLFSQVSGLPPGWSLSYTGTVENPLSVVLINPDPFVELPDALYLRIL